MSETSQTQVAAEQAKKRKATQQILNKERRFGLYACGLIFSNLFFHLVPNNPIVKDMPFVFYVLRLLPILCTFVLIKAISRSLRIFVLDDQKSELSYAKKLSIILSTSVVIHFIEETIFEYAKETPTGLLLIIVSFLSLLSATLRSYGYIFNNTIVSKKIIYYILGFIPAIAFGIIFYPFLQNIYPMKFLKKTDSLFIYIFAYSNILTCAFSTARVLNGSNKLNSVTKYNALMNSYLFLVSNILRAIWLVVNGSRFELLQILGKYKIEYRHINAILILTSQFAIFGIAHTANCLHRYQVNEYASRVIYNNDKKASSNEQENKSANEEDNHPVESKRNLRKRN